MLAACVGPCGHAGIDHNNRGIMPHTFASPLPQLHVGHAQATLGPLTLFPIWTDAPIDPQRRYRLPERGRVGVATEHEDGPVVSELILDNPFDEPLLALEGMTLDGGWQHRVLTRSILAAPRQRTPIPVRCIEQARWHGERAQRFSAYDAPLRTRATLRERRPRGPFGGAAEADQGQVWANVEQYSLQVGISSPTSSLHEMQHQAAGAVTAQLQRVRPLPAQRGVVVAALGHPVLVEITDHPDTLAQRWDALLAGLALDAAAAPYVPVPARRARSFVNRMAQVPVTVRMDAGTGAALDADDQHLVSLRGIAQERNVLHAVALNIRHEFVLAA